MALHQKISDWPPWIEKQLVRRGIIDKRVLEAFSRVRREWFLSPDLKARALSDGPIPIGCRQTVSQPFVVAVSLQALRLTGGEKVLDVGTGSGYQAVLLSHLAGEVYTIEILQKLFVNARLLVENHARSPVYTRCGDGSRGWSAAAPFDAIVAGACAPSLPNSLVEQLAIGGRLVLPVGNENLQRLYLFEKQADGNLNKTLLERVVFVPLIGAEGTGARPLD